MNQPNKPKTIRESVGEFVSITESYLTHFYMEEKQQIDLIELNKLIDVGINTGKSKDGFVFNCMAKNQEMAKMNIPIFQVYYGILFDAINHPTCSELRICLIAILNELRAAFINAVELIGTLNSNQIKTN
jgi:hypothetical protein